MFTLMVNYYLLKAAFDIGDFLSFLIVFVILLCWDIPVIWNVIAILKNKSGCKDQMKQQKRREEKIEREYGIIDFSEKSDK